MTFVLGPRRSAYDFLKEVPTRFDIRNGIIVVAWARRTGVGLLKLALGDGLRCVDVVVGMANRGTTAEALAHLQSISRQVFVYHTHYLQTFHPKVYLFDDGQEPPSDAALLVGSSNLTGGGLYQNFEGNLALELRPSNRPRDLETFDSVVNEFSGLLESPYCEQLNDFERIGQLLEDGHVSTETALRQKRSRSNSQITKQDESLQLPGPPPIPLLTFPSLPVMFGGVDDESADAGPSDIEGQTITVLDYTAQFYVRTLTEKGTTKLTSQSSADVLK